MLGTLSPLLLTSGTAQTRKWLQGDSIVHASRHVCKCCSSSTGSAPPRSPVRPAWIGTSLGQFFSGSSFLCTTFITSRTVALAFVHKVTPLSIPSWLSILCFSQYAFVSPTTKTSRPWGTPCWLLSALGSSTFSVADCWLECVHLCSCLAGHPACLVVSPLTAVSAFPNTI